ncbi:uncharacterized protein JN550_011184 [Neoarthrinium moseri]|uniref:uncharacterized protein n=1 Tax=Neoarthrinium moseri TaxID=1658444 RepID=UPI001FDC87E6|nr:uncharacterized protein JN550_011184 [Neoarthrinium moseri]KAI1860869.1 hypothetical protein JN550_011184 [Neoarthrinium moseri]
MDGVSSVASIIAIVQAGGMLLQVGKAFHETFISKDNDHRAEHSSLQVASIEEFIEKIELFQVVKTISPQVSLTGKPQNPTLSTATTASTAATAPGLDTVLEQCKIQLRRLQDKVKKFRVPPGAGRLKRLVKTIKMKMDEAEFAQIDANITILLQQLTLYMSLVKFQISNEGFAANQAHHDEVMRKYGEIEQRFDVFDDLESNHQSTLLEELGKLLDGQLELKAQMAAFEQGHQMIVSSFEKLSIAPKLERSLSGTTAATDDDELDDEELIAPIAPGLMKHPGFGFRKDRLKDPMVGKLVMDEIDAWLGPAGLLRPILCARISGDEHATHDLCNRIVQEIASSGAKLLCYNGQPRDGPPPAPGWYSMRHVIWWLAGQLLIPVPHLDGHMPERAYVPNVEAVCERIEKQKQFPVFVVFYLLTRSCPTEVDRKLYELLISRLIDLAKAGSIRLLVFSDDPTDDILGRLPPEVIITVNEDQEKVSLADWEPEVGDAADPVE